jgi:uncharacterized membrane protein
VQRIDEDERRASDEGVERGRRASAAKGVTQKLPGAQQADIVTRVLRGADEQRLLPIRPESSSASIKRTTEEQSRDKDAASSFCRMGVSERAIRSKGSQVASVKP